VKEWRLILKIVVTWPVSLVLFVDICLPRLGRHLSTRERKRKGKRHGGGGKRGGGARGGLICISLVSQEEEANGAPTRPSGGKKKKEKRGDWPHTHTHIQTRITDY
jgi:hypothetical protein